LVVFLQSGEISIPDFGRYSYFLTLILGFVSVTTLFSQRASALMELESGGEFSLPDFERFLFLLICDDTNNLFLCYFWLFSLRWWRGWWWEERSCNNCECYEMIVLTTIKYLYYQTYIY
jgi:hypothetical protein